MRKQVVPFTIELEDQEEVPARVDNPLRSRPRTGRAVLLGGLAGVVCGFCAATFVANAAPVAPQPIVSASPTTASVPVDDLRGMTPDAVEHWLATDNADCLSGLPSTPDAAERWLGNGQCR